MIIARGGKPIASIRLIDKKHDREKLFGWAKEIMGDLSLDDFNSMNEDIEKEFYGGC